MRTFALPLALLVLFGACQADTRKMSKQEKYRLYASEPDLVRNKGISVGLTSDAVEKKLGRPGMRITGTVAGDEISTWEYYVVTEAWYPPGNEDTGVFTHEPGTNTKVSAQPRLDLTFVNGTLVAIGDHSKRTFTATPVATEGPKPVDPEVIAEARKRFYGKVRER